jgi:hypothetical protein
MARRDDADDHQKLGKSLYAFSAHDDAASNALRRSAPAPFPPAFETSPGPVD